LRTTPEDFIVEELPGFERPAPASTCCSPSRSAAMNTGFAAKHIAQWAGVGEVAIGYAGMKDRHAVTRQRFSVHLPKKVAPDLSTLDFAQGEETPHRLEHTWHAKKLPRGALAGNRFVLTLRGVERRNARPSRSACRRSRNAGVPNYFGEQRFGREGDNVANARACSRPPRATRAAHDADFGRTFGAVQPRARATRAWRQLGSSARREVWMLDGSRSVVRVRALRGCARAAARIVRHPPDGPVWGRGELRTSGEAARLEADVLSDEEALAIRAGLEAEGSEAGAPRAAPEAGRPGVDVA
jgi:tRNA pseudouridine13 synthase